MAPRVRPTSVQGLLVVDLDVHRDERGWFKENWQRARMVGLGLPDFGPVQHSVAHNGPAGVTRGIHAEPWDKLVSLVRGRAFGAWVDLREGPTFGAVHTEVLDEGTAVFVPRGVGNSYQTLVEDTVYSYLVNEHWSADAAYTMLDLADPTAAIPWPIPLAGATVSAKDRDHPLLADVSPVPPGRTLVLGAGGQLGRALLDALPHAEGLTREQLDLTDPDAIRALDLGDVDTVLNAAAYTDVDGAQTPAGRQTAWSVNATAVSRLARAATEHRCTLVHYSSDYVFDGTRESSGEDDPPSPLGVYGQSKAAGDLAVAGVPRHYLLRTSWVVGEGPNFVSTMRDLARRGASPQVVDDQVGRLTFATELARATGHLLHARPAAGTYNVTGGGDPASWADLAREVYRAEGADPDLVRPTTSGEYARGTDREVAPRPARSVLRLDRIRATGFEPEPQLDSLARHLHRTT